MVDLAELEAELLDHEATLEHEPEDLDDMDPYEQEAHGLHPLREFRQRFVTGIAGGEDLSDVRITDGRFVLAARLA